MRLKATNIYTCTLSSNYPFFACQIWKNPPPSQPTGSLGKLGPHLWVLSWSFPIHFRTTSKAWPPWPPQFPAHSYASKRICEFVRICCKYPFYFSFVQIINLSRKAVLFIWFCLVPVIWMFMSPVTGRWPKLSNETERRP